MNPGFYGMGIEVIGRCNASCEFCGWGSIKDVKTENVFTGEILTRSKEKIDLGLLDAILTEHPIKGVICTGLSEPFLAPDRVFYLAEQGEKRGFSLTVYTNGYLLDESIMRELLGYKCFVSIFFSMNAFTDETRRKVMGLPLQPSEENLIKFIELRDLMGRQDIPVGNVFMLTPNNRHEQNLFRRKWKEIFSKYVNCNEPGVFNATNWSGEVKNYYMTSEGNASGCLQWTCSAPTISVDGQIYLCCYTSHISFGHVLDQEAVTKWLNRREVFNFKDISRSDNYPSMCKDCSHRFANNWK